MKKLFTLFTLLLVVCGMRATTVEVTIANYAASNGWSNGTQYPSISLDDNITATATGGGNTGKYYTSGNQWRIYQNEDPTLTITAASGYTLNAVTITYASQNNGVLLQGTTQIASDTEVSASGNSIEFGVGNTGSATNGQIRVTKITVTYSGSSDTRQATTIELGGGYMTKFTYGANGDGVDMPAATVKGQDGNPIAGATVTWAVEKVSGNDALVPTISGNKINIPNHSYGKLNVTASYAGDATTYQPSTKSYTIDVYKGRMNIAEILDDFQGQVISGYESWADGVPTSYWQVNESGDDITAMTATVTYVNGAYTYIKDENGDNLLLYGSGLGFVKGDLITGDQGGGEWEAMYGTLKTYNGLLELAVTENNFMKEDEGQDVTPKTLTNISELGDLDNMNAYLKIENAVYVADAGSKNYTFKVGDTEFTVRQNWNNVSVDGLEEGATYTLEGMGAVYNETKQLYLTSFEKTADAPTGIEAITTDELDVNAPIYNTAGQQVNKDYKGVVIQKGKKILVK